ncbi:MAG TPA: ABC transporter permease, partial [Patescibacteria group bacterium]|nr:ABC transporter permease [Patescibacteria group bacterium]
LAGTALALLWRLHGSPFGYGLRAVRDSQRRAEALGINAARQRWYGFACGAGLAGAAGGLFAFLKGSVFPDVASISTSVDALVMMLLGGMGSIAGPLVGATAYTLMRLGLTSHTDIWRMVVGAVIVVLVLAFPGGLLGARRR